MQIIPNWPEALGLPLNDGYKHTLETIDSVAMTAGIDRARRVLADPVSEFSVSFHWNPDQLQQFRQFARHQIDGTAKWFVMPLWSGGGMEPHTVRIKKANKYQLKQPDWVVSFVLECLERYRLPDDIGEILLDFAPSDLQSAAQVADKTVCRYADIINSIDWTQNYNGINSHIIPKKPWLVEGDFDISLRVFRSSSRNQTALYDSVNGKRWLDFSKDSNQISSYFGDKTNIKIYGTNDLLGLLSITIKRRGTDYTLRVNDREITKTINVESSGVLDIIGSGGKQLYYLGQIYNLKLTDLSNTDNCRFYPGIIKSIDMPISTILKDEYGDGSTNGQMFNFGSSKPHVPVN